MYVLCKYAINQTIDNNINTFDFRHFGADGNGSDSLVLKLN